MELLPCLLLLLHHTHNYWLWGLCGPAEKGGPPGENALCGVQLHVHPGGANCYWGLPELGGASLPHHEH